MKLNQKEISKLAFLVVYEGLRFEEPETKLTAFADTEQTAAFAIVNKGRVFRIGEELNPQATLGVNQSD